MSGLFPLINRLERAVFFVPSLYHQTNKGLLRTLQIFCSICQCKGARRCTLSREGMGTKFFLLNVAYSQPNIVIHAEISP